MNFLDIRTVVFGQFITDAVCAAVLTFLWLQNRKRYAGMFFWVVDFILQTTAILLIVLRGGIPDWVSLLSSPFVVAGAWIGYLGLERFIGKRSPQVYNYILLGFFTLVHFYFVFVYPSLEARNLILSLGLLIICLQCAWLMLRRAGVGLVRTTQVVGWVFAAFCLASLVRIFILIVVPDLSNDVFRSGFYDALILMSYQILLIFLTFSLVLMVNRLLLIRVKTQEEKFTKAFHSSPYAILITRLADGLILDVNRGFEEMFGYQPSESIGKTTHSLHLWVKEADRQEIVTTLTAEGEVQGREFQFRMKSGRERTGQFYAEILTVENEQLILSSISDITERKQADEIRRESEGRYRSLFENMLNGFAYCQMIFDGDHPQDFIYLDVNRAFETLTGLKDVIGKRVSEVIPGILESDPDLIKTYGRVALTGKPEVFETYVEALKMWFSVSVYGLGKGFFVAVFDVITERKRDEEKLREDEARLHQALDAAKGGAWEWNLQTDENIWSEELWKVYGLEPHSCAPSYEAWLQTVHPDDRASASRAVKNAAQEAIELYAEWRVRDRDGTERWLMSRGQPIFDSGGQAVRYIGTVLDITARKRIEEALLAAEAKYRHTLDVMLEGCQIIGFDWRYLYLNDAADKQNRRPKEELLGQRYMDIWAGIESTEVFAVLRQCMEEREPRALENEFVFPDGKRGWFDLKIYPVPEGIVLLSIDITESKQADEAVLASAAKLDAALANMTDAVFISDNDGMFIKFNEAFATFHKFKNIAECAKTLAEYPEFLDVFLPSGEPAPLDQWAVPRALRGEIGTNVEYSLRRKDTGETWVGSYSFAPIRDKQGKIVGSVVVGRDVTELKRADAALRERETRYRELVQNANSAIIRWRRDGTILFFNEYAQTLFGYSGVEAIGRNVNLLLPEMETTGNDQSTLVQDIIAHPENFVNQVNENICRDGRRVWMAWTNKPIRDEDGQVSEILAVGVDVTERRRAEEAQRESELLFRSLFDLSPDAVILIDPNDPNIPSRIVDCNKAACLMNGYSRDELVGQTVDILNATPYTETGRIAYLKNLREAGNLKLEVFHRHKNGAAFPVEVATAFILVGERELIIGIDRDITERKQVEQALRESEANFRALAENAGEGVLIAGEGGVHLFANPAAAAITGYTVDELLHLNARKLAHPDEAPKIIDRLQKRLSGETIPNRYETVIMNKLGQKIPIEISTNKTSWKGQPADIVFIQDITSRKLAEDELRRTLDELKRSNADLEQFAYVASHDLQEPLRMVSSYMQLLERRYKGKLDKDADEFIGFAVDGAERMQRLINDLLAYSRLGTRGQPFTPVSSEKALTQALDNLQLAIGENKAQVTHDPLPEVLADESQLVQLFQNLLANAIKFHGKKRPRVHVSVRESPQEWIFSVRDNGIGLDPQYAERIFIIFQRLNSREQYAGTGIGLAMCKKIVQRHGGRIWVESQPGQGATFNFSLPKQEEVIHDNPD